MEGNNEGVHELPGKGNQFMLLIWMMVIVSGQIKNKVLGNTHLFSTYLFNGASQPMTSYDYIQNEINYAMYMVNSKSQMPGPK